MPARTTNAAPAPPPARASWEEPPPDAGRETRAGGSSTATGGGSRTGPSFVGRVRLEPPRGAAQRLRGHAGRARPHVLGVIAGGADEVGRPQVLDGPATGVVTRVAHRHLDGEERRGALGPERLVAAVHEALQRRVGGDLLAAVAAADRQRRDLLGRRGGRQRDGGEGGEDDGAAHAIATPGAVRRFPAQRSRRRTIARRRSPMKTGHAWTTALTPISSARRRCSPCWAATPARPSTIVPDRLLGGEHDRAGLPVELPLADRPAGGGPQAVERQLGERGALQREDLAGRERALGVDERDDAAEQRRRADVDVGQPLADERLQRRGGPLGARRLDRARHLAGGDGAAPRPAREIDHERRELVGRGLGQPLDGHGGEVRRRGLGVLRGRAARGHRARGGDQRRKRTGAHAAGEPTAP